MVGCMDIMISFICSLEIMAGSLANKPRLLERLQGVILQLIHIGLCLMQLRSQRFALGLGLVAQLDTK